MGGYSTASAATVSGFINEIGEDKENDQSKRS